MNKAIIHDDPISANYMSQLSKLKKNMHNLKHE